MALTIKELLAADTVSQAADKINFNFDQLLLNGGGPAGPQGPQGPPGPIGGRGIRGSQWYEDPNTTGGPTDPNTIIFPDLEPNDSYLANDGNVWEYDGTVWVNTGIDLTGPQGIAAQGLWDETGVPPLIGQEILYPSTYGLGNDVRSTFVGGVPSTDLVSDPNYYIDGNILSTVNSGISSFNIQVPTDGVSAIKFLGSTTYSSNYTNDIGQAQAINLLQGDSLVFQDLNSSTALSAMAEFGYRFFTQNRSMLTRTGRSFTVESGSTSVNGLMEPGDITLRIVESPISNPGIIRLDNKEAANLSYLQIGGNFSAFTTNTKAGSIGSESVNIWHGVTNQFKVEAEGLSDAIFLESLNGSIKSDANSGNISENAINIYETATNSILSNAGNLITLHAGATSGTPGAGVQLNTGNFWAIPNNISNRIASYSSGAIELRSKGGIDLNSGSDGTYSNTTPSSGYIKLQTRSNNISNVLLSTNSGTVPGLTSPVFQVIDGTQQDSIDPGQFALIHAQTNITSNGQISLGQTLSSDRTLTGALKKAAVVINTSNLANQTGTGYIQNYPILKLGMGSRQIGALVGSGTTGAAAQGYFGGGAHIVGPYWNNINKSAGATVFDNEWGSALSIRSDYETGYWAKGTYSKNPGAVYLYVPSEFGTPELALTGGERIRRNSVRLWGTDLSDVDRSISVNSAGTEQGGITLGLNMQSAATPPNPNGTTGAGYSTVVGRVGLYGVGTSYEYQTSVSGTGGGFPAAWYQSPTAGLAKIGTGDEWAQVNNVTTQDKANYGNNNYASVNVGDEFRSRNTFKVFGDYVGDHYASVFEGHYFGPTLEHEEFLSGAQGNSAWCASPQGDASIGTAIGLAGATTGTSNSAGVEFTALTPPFSIGSIRVRYRMTFQKVGRVVSFAGTLELGKAGGENGPAGWNTTDLIALSNFNGYGRQLRVRLPLPTQLNLGGASKDKGGIISTKPGEGLMGAYPGSMNGSVNGIYTLKGGSAQNKPGVYTQTGSPLTTNTAFDGTSSSGVITQGSELAWNSTYEGGSSGSGVGDNSWTWLMIDGISPYAFQEWNDPAPSIGIPEGFPRNNSVYGNSNPLRSPQCFFYNTKYSFTGQYEIRTEI